MSGVSHVLCYSASSTVTDPSLHEGIPKMVVALARLFRCKFVAPDNIAIEILELLDAIGVTRRTGDARRMNAGAAAFIGDAVPLARSR